MASRRLKPLLVTCGCALDAQGEKESAYPTWLPTLALGQVISAALAGCGIGAASLADRGVNLPLTLNWLNYALLSTYLFCLCGGGGGSMSSEPRLPLWRYALYAVVDVEANFLVVFAFRYTSITSIMLLDCFTIPCTMLLSAAFLGSRYRAAHYAAVSVALSGLGLMVLSDARRQSVEGNPHPQALRGDLICLLGAFMYACCNVMQEFIVKNYDRRRFLGMTGAFGSAIAGAQLLALECQQLAAVAWTPVLVSFTALYSGSLFLVYSLTSIFLRQSDAAVFNLSLLTSDVYAVVFASLVEGAGPGWLYVAAFALVVTGLALYHAEAPPALAAVGGGGGPVFLALSSADERDGEGCRGRDAAEDGLAQDSS